MTRIPPGTYTIQVHDLSTTHDFHLTGPGGVDRRTDVGEIEHPIWTVTFRAGTYTFKCDVHASMKGTFVPRV
jgi:plastocyanin